MFIPNDYLMLIGILVLVLIMAPVIYILSLRSNAPEAFTILKAIKNREPMAILHYPNGICRLYIPEKEGYDLGDVAPYWRIGKIYKYKDLTATKTEMWEGKVPVYHYYTNIMEPVAIKTAVAMDQIKTLLAENNINVDGIEDLAFYLIAELDNASANIEKTLNALHIEDESSKKRIAVLLNFINSKKADLEKIRLRTSPFSFQTAQRAIDDLQAAGSIYFERAKSIIETAALRREEATNKNFIYIGLAFLFMCVGVAVLATGLGWV